MTKNVLRVSSKFLSTVGERTFRFALSTKAADRDGDTLAQDGWKLDNYRANPVVLWMHDKRTPPIGKMINIGLQGDDLVGDIQFATAEQNPFADTIFKLVEGGFLNAGSVGFMPMRWEINADGGLDFKEQELLEYSIVTVPANPEAVRRACELVGAEKAGAFLKFASDDAATYVNARKALLAETEASKPQGVFAGPRLRSAEAASARLQLSEV